ncbi:uncharacterized protein LOC123547384 [Mercenaria mercenaria]|uniref:uncharacterized protein LOC123547384 n=1 Tax=Mercenaria mercenaria TaxID=6596 RepID=UPI00234E7BD2|nr:uncharacterized protein LOC123547384 [Mercenaria mercenaria]
MKFGDSVKTLISCTFLVLTIIVVEVNASGLCITDDDCTAKNTFCDEGGVCMCTAGHSHLNGYCSPVFGRSCLDDLNCDDGRTFCKDSKCVCNTYEWKEENGICASYYGSFCSDWSDCGLSYNYVCEDNTCKCGTGYKLKSGFCEKVINSQCRMDYSTEDCPLDHAVCKIPYWNQNEIYGKCKCESGFDENNGICIQVLGSSCANVGCGNTLHYSYKHLDPSFKRPDYNYFYWSSTDYWFDWSYYYHLHLSCNIDNTCVCDHGFKTDASGIFCEPVYGTPCEGADSCGTYHGYTCDSISKQCVCAENYISYNQEWRYVDDAETNDNLYYYDNHASTIVQLCKPELGQSCSIVSCAFEHADCDENDTCSCDEGYTESIDGTCQQVLGMSCIRETFCQIVPGGFCADDNTCKCKEGYSQAGHLCQLVLDTDCTANVDCQLEHTVCNEGMCECKSSVDKNGGRCYGQACSDVPSLPDIRRRSVSYIPVEGEPIIDDSWLKEGWYTIGRHSIHWSTESPPESGNCTTFYPVYLTDPISTSQQDALAAGEDIIVTAKVGNMDLYGHSEQVNLTLRQCGQDTHVYVTPPSTHFSGICLDNEDIPDITRSTGIKATVLTDLLFTNQTVDNVTKHTPYIVFSCVASEFVITSTYERYPYEGYVTDDDVFFYYVHWYIDSVHFRTIGPLRRYSFINGSSIFEMDIIEAGYKLGFGIRCTFEISENPNGQNSLLAISEEIFTGFQPHHIYINESTDNYFFHLISSSPLGCETTEENGDGTCDLFWPVLMEDDGVWCNQPVSENEHHELCRVFVRGCSYGKYMNNWGSWWSLSQWENNYNHHYDYNHTVTDDVDWYFSNNTSELLGVYIDIQGTAKTGSMKIKFGPTETTTGHMIWNNYKMPDINLHIERSPTVKEACKISIVNIPVLTKETDWTFAFSTENVEIDQVGEFIMYRSTKIPVYVQIQTEACSWTTNGVCLCAVNYRDGDNTYIYSYCNGLMRIGQTNGELTNRRIDHVTLINDIALDIETWNNRIVNVSLNTNHSGSTLEDGEGLCMFSPGSYKHRSGTEETDSDGFLSSWRLLINESLLNPLNHKAVSWLDEYTQCGCPDNTEILQEREETYYYNDTYSYNYTSYLYTNEWYSSHYNVHWGFIRCFAESICKVNHSGGGEWSGSLLPVFSVTSVKARMEIRYDRKWPLLHLFCDFEGRDGYQYGITWKADDDVVYTSPLQDYSSVENFNITNDDLHTDKFLLEVKFSCGVSIHDVSGAELISSQYSDAISAVEFVTTELLMPRGGDVLIQIRLNIPLVCTKGHPCSFDFKLFGTGNDCSHSSIAIKGRQTCGQRIIGTSTEDELVNEARIINITVTTTNNAKYSLKDTFYLKVKLAAYGDTSPFWLHTFSQVLTVFVRDDENYWQRNYCYANNDPRMRTFDGQYYNHMLTGLFALMRHKLLPVEVQLETRQCGGWRVACACGVTIRAGRDVFTINHCHGDHVTGYLLADDRILRVMKRTAHRYQIYLPHGTMVDVRISSWNGFMVNVFIYPSPADMKHVEGLCGNFNGDWGDDLIHSDGNVTSSSRYYWWRYDPDPEDFVQSWGLAFTNDLDLTDVDEIDATLHSWYENDVFCVCTGTDGDGEIKCSANEQDTCMTKPDKPGVDL